MWDLLKESTGIERVIILGAGFSAGAGLPLLIDLPRLTFENARSLTLYKVGGLREPDGQGQTIIRLLKYYYPFLQSPRRQLLNGMPKWFDFEHFMSLVSCGSFFEERTGERWDSQTTKDLFLIRSCLASAVTRPLVTQDVPSAYLEFAERLKDGNSLIVSFNWDVLLETALDAVGVPFTYDIHHWIETEYKTTLVMKMHGSANWFPDEDIDGRRLRWRESAKAIGGWIPGLSFMPPNPSALLACYSDSVAPILVVPGFDKLRMVERLGELWIRPWQLIQNDLDVIIIGLSIREDDYHTRAFLYPQLVRGTTHHNLRVKVIDKAAGLRDEEAVKRRFRRVRNVRYRFDGFGEHSLNFIFSQPDDST